MNKRATYRVNADLWTKLADILCASPDEFNSDQDTLRGRKVDSGTHRYAHTGKLPEPFDTHYRESDVDYVIYSYKTPIAWRERTVSPNRVKASNGHTIGYSNYRWIVPPVRYSVTTSKHQGRVRTALSQISGGID